MRDRRQVEAEIAAKMKAYYEAVWYMTQDDLHFEIADLRAELDAIKQKENEG